MIIELQKRQYKITTENKQVLKLAFKDFKDLGFIQWASWTKTVKTFYWLADNFEVEQAKNDSAKRVLLFCHEFKKQFANYSEFCLFAEKINYLHEDLNRINIKIK